MIEKLFLQIIVQSVSVLVSSSLVSRNNNNVTFQPDNLRCSFNTILLSHPAFKLGSRSLGDNQ